MNNMESNEDRGFYVHPQGICETSHVGKGTKIWAFCHVLPGAKIGEECNICDSVFIENDVVIGNRVTIKSGVQLWDGVRLEDDVFVGPNATFTNDPFPRSKKHLKKFPVTTLQRGASIGANSTILPGLTIGSNSMVGAGAVVSRDVPPNAIVYGNPAVISGYTDTVKTDERQKNLLVASEIKGRNKSRSSLELSVKGCKLVNLPTFNDLRGRLMVTEFSDDMPFTPSRLFFVYGVPNTKVRGEHAHKACAQLLVAVSGNLSIVVDDGKQREEVLLDNPGLGLLIPPMVWGIQYRFSPDAVLGVYASNPYDASDYIREYDVFLQMVKP